jgi:thiol-disulfide isomerase/thioredoxin
MRLPAIRGFLLAGSVFGACAGVALAQVAPATGALLQRAAPEFRRMDLRHRKVDLNSYRGKVVLLNFWATWCAPCQLEIPRFVAWQRQYGPSGLQVIGISMDDDPALVRKLYKKLGLNYPVAMGDEKLGELYGGILGLPVTYLIDSNGKVSAEYHGEADLNAIEVQLKLLLADH